MDYMKPIATTEAPTGKGWVYEVKYDGFRAQLHWNTDSIHLISRNGKDMTGLFPEVIAYCRKQQSDMESILPIILDGELAVLNHQYQANFELIQQRGRLKNIERIEQAAQDRPASFLAFDIRQHHTTSLKNKDFTRRKQALFDIFTAMKIPETIDLNRPLNYIPFHTDPGTLWNTSVNIKRKA